MGAGLSFTSVGLALDALSVKTTAIHAGAIVAVYARSLANARLTTHPIYAIAALGKSTFFAVQFSAGHAVVLITTTIQSAVVGSIAKPVTAISVGDTIIARTFATASRITFRTRARQGFAWQATSINATAPLTAISTIKAPPVARISNALTLIAIATITAIFVFVARPCARCAQARYRIENNTILNAGAVLIVAIALLQATWVRSCIHISSRARLLLATSFCAYFTFKTIRIGNTPWIRYAFTGFGISNKPKATSTYFVYAALVVAIAIPGTVTLNTISGVWIADSLGAYFRHASFGRAHIARGAQCRRATV